MEAWREKALELFPDDREGILEEESIWQLWIFLWQSFKQAHEEPVELTRIQATFQFARWALGAGDHGPGDRASEEDWATATVVNFYEDLPTSPKIRKVIHEFMDREEILGFSEIFKHHLKPDEHREFMKTILAARDRHEKALAKGP